MDTDPNELVAVFNPTPKIFARTYQGNKYIILPLNKLDNIPRHVADNLAKHLAFKIVSRNKVITQRDIESTINRICLYDRSS